MAAGSSKVSPGRLALASTQEGPFTSVPVLLLPEESRSDVPWPSSIFQYPTRLLSVGSSTRRPPKLVGPRVWLEVPSRTTVDVPGANAPPDETMVPARTTDAPPLSVPPLNVTVPPGTHNRSSSVQLPEPLTVI